MQTITLYSYTVDQTRGHYFQLLSVDIVISKLLMLTIFSWKFSWQTPFEAVIRVVFMVALWLNQMCIHVSFLHGHSWVIQA